MNSLQGFEITALRLLEQYSTMSPLDDVLSIFTFEKIGKDEMLGVNIVFLDCANLTKESPTVRRCGKCVMLETAKMFQT